MRLVAPVRIRPISWSPGPRNSVIHLLLRLIKNPAGSPAAVVTASARTRTVPVPAAKPAPAAELRLVRPPKLGHGPRNRAGVDLQRRAWQGALAHRAGDGSLPSGSAATHGRQERWDRLVKKVGHAGTLCPTSAPQTTAPDGELSQTIATGANNAQ